MDVLNEKIMSPVCIVCGADQWNTLFRKLRQCQACRFVQAKINASQVVLRQLYDEDYFRGKEYSDYLLDSKIHRRNFMHRLSEIQTIVGHPREVFEIGCAYGLWLELLVKNDIPCSGIDISSIPVRYAVEQLHQNAFCGDFLQFVIEPSRFDVYCMWDTIEHLLRPDLFVKRILELLPVGGIFVFTTGDIGSRYACWRGRHWRMIHPPTHLQYFSKQTVRKLLERFGFCDIKIHSVPIYRNLRSVIRTTIALQNGLPRIVANVADTILPKWIQEQCVGWIDLGDIMLVSAKKSIQHKTN